jgi:hypothetical protein
MNKIFFDTEFTGLHKGTTLISVGLIAENGKMFYAELTDYSKEQLNPWLAENVIANLKFNESVNFVREQGDSTEAKGDKKTIRKALRKWLEQFTDVQFVSDVGHYDFILLIDLLGESAFDLPRNCCPTCIDINQDIARVKKVSNKEAFDISRESLVSNIDGDKHNALYDAKVLAAIYKSLLDLEYLKMRLEQVKEEIKGRCRPSTEVGQIAYFDAIGAFEKEKKSLEERIADLL